MALIVMPNNFEFNGAPSGGLYLIPESDNTLGHWNANDLANGTARVGTPFTANGTIAFTNGGLSSLSSVGPFTDANYYSQTNPIYNPTTPPFTIAYLVSYTDASNSPCIWDADADPNGGETIQIYNNGQPIYTGLANQISASGTDYDTFTANVFAPNSIGIVLAGVDSSGTTWLQLNNGPIASLAGVWAPGPGLPQEIFLGTDIHSSGFYLQGKIYEVMYSYDVPSAAAFTALYNKIIASGVVGPTLPPSGYLIPESGTTLLHVNATDLHAGTARVGGAWSKSGTVAYTSAGSLSTVGPFSDVNYFYQSTASPINLTSGPFTAVAIFNPTSLANTPIVAGLGTAGATGWMFQEATGTGIFYVSNGATQTSAGVNPVLSSLNVALGGLDGAGNLFSIVNGSAVAIGGGGTMAASLTDAFIGKYYQASYALSGTMTEFYVSTATPSSAALELLYMNIYNSIVLAEA